MDVTLLTTFEAGSIRDRLLTVIGPKVTVRVVTSHQGLAASRFGPDSVLLSFCADVIVPGDVLEQLAGRAVNFHPGSPEFPGRVPCDMAIYQDAREFGATAHLMTKNVDDGPIVGVKRFSVPQGCTSTELNALAVRANLRLFESLVPLIIAGKPLPILDSVRWKSVRSTKRNQRAGRYLSELLSEDEFLRRIRAFGDKNDPFTTTIHGIPFSLKMASAAPQLRSQEDLWFTEEAYRSLLCKVKALGYACVGYDAAESSGRRQLILHHNARFSVHRAKRMATIEAELGISSSYFFSFSSRFYSLIEDDVARLVREIGELGHEVGLLVSLDIRKTPPDAEALRSVGRNCALLQDRTGSVAKYASGEGGAVATIDREKIVWNARFDDWHSGEKFWRSASDASGYWQPLSADDLVEQGHSRVRIVADPAWWTPEPLTLRERLARCVLGRARATWRAIGEDSIRFGKQEPGAASTTATSKPHSL